MSLLTKKWGLISRLKKIMYKIIFSKQLEIDESVTFRNGFHIFVEKEGKVKIGANTFFNNYCSINVMGNIVIGENCLFGENVKIYDHNHRFRDRTKAIATQGFSVGEVFIGDNCWIGSNVVILKGSHIGNHCVVAAGMVVDGIIQENSIVYRNGEIKEIDEYK